MGKKNKRDVDKAVNPAKMGQPQEDKPTKQEYEVAKFLRAQLPPKKTTLLGHKVDYFIGSKAIDELMKSKWAASQSKKSDDALFTSRESVMDFMDTLIRHKFFHRAKKVIVIKEQKGASKAEANKAEKDRVAAESSAAEDRTDREDKAGKSSKAAKKEPPKKRIKLDMHMEQVFVDSNEPYVWIYDPVSLSTWIWGALLVVGSIAVCLFPLWPRTVRNYVYYLSVAAAGLLFFIIGLAILRVIIFCIIWAVSFGKHHLWILPNLTADVGFFESFWPLYAYEYKGPPREEDEEDGSEEDEGEEAEGEAGDPGKVQGTSQNLDSKENDSQDDDGEEEPSPPTSRKSSQQSNDSFEVVEESDVDRSQREDDEQRFAAGPRSAECQSESTAADR